MYGMISHGRVATGYPRHRNGQTIELNAWNVTSGKRFWIPQNSFMKLISCEQWVSI